MLSRLRKLWRKLWRMTVGALRFVERLEQAAEVAGYKCIRTKTHSVGNTHLFGYRNGKLVLNRPDAIHWFLGSIQEDSDLPELFRDFRLFEDGEIVQLTLLNEFDWPICSGLAVYSLESDYEHRLKYVEREQFL